ncbi:MAG: helix-turn-helix transcriptional regulator [Chloroflexi bacterium]|nr:helix-turn-helix transcriptional regulator [Chloroflexota bacterium]NWJ96714.1 helix-turn-helix transcriptional regulator [Chloroflexota bacterium]
MMQIDKVRFGSYIKQRRKAVGYNSMYKLAEVLNVDHSTIGKIEAGERLPSFELFLDLASKLKIKPSELMSELAECATGFEREVTLTLPPSLLPDDIELLQGIINLISQKRLTSKAEEPE